jgi:hypothetical protein
MADNPIAFGKRGLLDRACRFRRDGDEVARTYLAGTK